jgi:hypothetical protein
MFRISRERREGPDPFLDLKIGLFLIGAILGAIGMARSNQTLITIAIVVVAIGILLRFVRKKNESDVPPAAE